MSVNLPEQLPRALPMFLFFTLFISIGLSLFFLLTRTRIRRFFIQPKLLLIGVLVFTGALLVVHFIPPQTHRIMYDEIIYLQIGQMIAETGEAVMGNHVRFSEGKTELLEKELNKQPTAYPFFIALFFMLFGTAEHWGFLLNNLALIAGAFLVSRILALYARNRWTSAAGAVIFFLIPHNLIWGNTTAAEPVASALALLCIYLALSYRKDSADHKLYLLSTTLVFAVQVRHEGLLLLPLTAAVLISRNWQILKKKSLWMSLLLFLSLCIPHFLHLYFFRNHPWGSDAAKFSLTWLDPNVRTNALYYINNRYFPTMLTMLAAGGLLFTRGRIHFKLVMIGWFVCFWGVFLFFYAGSYEYGMDNRFAVLSFAPLSILAALGMETIIERLGQNKKMISAALATIILLNVVRFLPFVQTLAEQVWACRADYEYAVELCDEVPSDGLVLTHNPCIFSLQRTNTAQMHIPVHEIRKEVDFAEKYPGGIYFHWNYWCNTGDEPSTYCKILMERYDWELLKERRARDQRYALYRMRRDQ